MLGHSRNRIPVLNSSLPCLNRPTFVKKWLRIDHTINSKYQLMGHYLHDAVSQGIYPPLWGNSSLSNGRNSHEKPLMVIHYQADANVHADVAQ